MCTDDRKAWEYKLNKAYHLATLQWLAVVLQQEIHDPVKAACCIQIFPSMIAKLKLLIE